MARQATCRTCRFWSGTSKIGTGQCRVNPPARGCDGVGRWPTTTSGSWCGSHAPHASDDDCAGKIDPGTDLCFGCDVLHLDPCGVCSGVGYHAPGCKEADNG